MTSKKARVSAWGAIFRMAWRHAWRRPLQSLFLVAGVAIGVAMIVAIDLANGSAERAFALGTETVAGRATHAIIGGPSGLDEQVYANLRRDLGFRMSAPVVEGYLVVDELDRQPMRLLGIDPFAESPFRAYLGTDSNEPAPDYLTPLMVQPNTVLLSSEIASRFDLQPGDVLNAQAGSSRHTLEIVGLLEPSDDLSRRALDGLLLTDISTAQEVLDRVGRLDRIDLIVPETPQGEAELARIIASLPPNARVEPTSARSGTVAEMSAAFSLNLTALSLLALVVGMFLIYNTVTFSVVQRRHVIGTLRSLGMTRREVYLLILLEAILLGLLGTLAGLGLGILLGRGAVQLVTRTINDLFFVVTVRDIEIPPLTMLKGTLIGISAAIFAAAIPAYEATSVAPAGALQRSNIEERSRRALPWVSVAAVVLLVIGTLIMIPDWNLVIAFTGLFVIIIGAALLAPVLTLGMMLLVQRIANAISGVIGRMAPRTIVRTLSRTSVAVAALMVAVSVIIGVGIMVSSFRATVELWLDDVLQADIFVSPPSLNASQILTTLDPAIVHDLATYPGITRFATTRGVNSAIFLDQSEQSGDSTDGSNTAIAVRLIAFSEDLAGEDRRYRDAVGDWQATWAAAEAGGIIVNDPLANRYNVNVGDELTVQTDRGQQKFTVVGISVDFDVNPVIFIHDPIYRQWWEDDAISSIGLFVAPGDDVDAMVAELRRAFGGRAELIITSNRGTRESALEVFDRTFAITVALQLLAALVAFIGILSTLMSLQLERIREIGVLRATGMTRRQLWRLSLLETGLIGTSAGVLAMPVGFVLAIILIYIINLRSFGWTLEMQLDPREFVQAFLVALGAALAAGIYPAWRMGRIAPAEAVRAE